MRRRRRDCKSSASSRHDVPHQLSDHDIRIAERTLAKEMHRRAWITTPGKYRLYVGSSAADIRATRSFTWIAPVDERAPIEQTTFEDDL